MRQWYARENGDNKEEEVALKEGIEREHINPKKGRLISSDFRDE